METLECSLSQMITLPDTERDLISRIAAGDADALRELYDAYGQRLAAFAFRLTGDPAAADEVVQDTLLAVWQGGARRFRNESRVITWLLGIVHHKALDRLRRQRDLPLMDSNAPAEPLEDGPAAQAARRDQHRLLQNGLDTLSMEHRTVLELVFYQGLSLAEAAEVCACPLGTIKSRLAYAKTALRGALNRAGVSEKDVE